MEVGIRELRDNLSRYIGLVRDGSELTVTDHGRAVAQVVPLDHPRQLDRLVAAGLVTRAASPKQPIPDDDRSPVEGLGDLISNQRR